jgi:uncharacterized membrane protein YfcA
MTVFTLTLLIAAVAFLAGLLGALTGLGGGVIIVPLLVLGFGFDMPYAVGVSLVAAIATSTTSASAYVRDGYSNLRLAMLLEIATTLGALGGAALVTFALVPTRALAVLFGVVLAFSALSALRSPPTEPKGAAPDPLATALKLDSAFPTPEGPQPYHLRNVPLGLGLMFFAGVLSGLLGIGSGALKVLALDQVMRVPFKVSTTTSNLMIGVTAAASAGVYLGRGYIDPGLAFPAVVGVVAGSLLGAQLLLRLNVGLLRYLFAAVILFLSVQMIFWRRTP